MLTLVGGRVVHGDQEFKDLAPSLPPVMPEWSPVRSLRRLPSSGCREGLRNALLRASPRAGSRRTRPDQVPRCARISGVPSAAGASPSEGPRWPHRLRAQRVSWIATARSHRYCSFSRSSPDSWTPSAISSWGTRVRGEYDRQRRLPADLPLPARQTFRCRHRSSRSVPSWPAHSPAGRLGSAMTEHRTRFFAIAMLVKLGLVGAAFVVAITMVDSDLSSGTD